MEARKRGFLAYLEHLITWLLRIFTRGDALTLLLRITTRIFQLHCRGVPPLGSSSLNVQLETPNGALIGLDLRVYIRLILPTISLFFVTNHTELAECMLGQLL